MATTTVPCAVMVRVDRDLDFTREGRGAAWGEVVDHLRRKGTDASSLCDGPVPESCTGQWAGVTDVDPPFGAGFETMVADYVGVRPDAATSLGNTSVMWSTPAQWSGLEVRPKELLGHRLATQTFVGTVFAGSCAGILEALPLRRDWFVASALDSASADALARVTAPAPLSARPSPFPGPFLEVYAPSIPPGDVSETASHIEKRLTSGGILGTVKFVGAEPVVFVRGQAPPTAEDIGNSTWLIRTWTPASTLFGQAASDASDGVVFSFALSRPAACGASAVGRAVGLRTPAPRCSVMRAAMSGTGGRMALSVDGGAATGSSDASHEATLRAISVTALAVAAFTLAAVVIMAVRYVVRQRRTKAQLLAQDAPPGDRVPSTPASKASATVQPMALVGANPKVGNRSNRIQSGNRNRSKQTLEITFLHADTVLDGFSA